MHSKSQTIREMFARIAPSYDFLNHTLSGSVDKRWRRKAISYLPEKENLKVLDLCAGTLDLTVAILEKFPHTHVTALDFSEKMLELGEKKIPQNLKNQVKIQMGDAMNLEFAEESFDAMICGFGLRNLPDNKKVLEQAYHLLKPKGRIVILEFFRPIRLLSRLFHATYGQWIIPTLGKWLSKDHEAYTYLFQSIQSYYSDKEFSNLMQACRFQVMAHQPLSGSVAHILVGEKG